MEKSWLIQRLVKPNPAGKRHAFGASRTGGFTPEARDILLQAFDFDYMGNGQFERGDVPEAIATAAGKIREYVLHEIEVETSSVAIEDWEAKYWRAAKDKTRKIQLLCRKEDLAEVKRRVRGWVKADGPGELCERTDLRYSFVDPAPDRNPSRGICGWIELENAFFFFTDAEMAKKALEVLKDLGAEVEAC